MITAFIANQLEIETPPERSESGDFRTPPKLLYRQEMMPKRFFAEVVCLSANGEFLAVAHFRDLERRGVVTVFQCSAGRWIPAGRTFEGDRPELYFGNALALSADGRTLAIAGDGDNKTAGVVGVYVFWNGQWHPKGQMLCGEAATHFGSSVALSADGNIVAIGQRRGASGGAVHVFHYTAGNWARQAPPLNDESAEGDFGISVSLSSAGDVVAIGANSFEAGRCGSVSILRYADHAWRRQGEVLKGEYRAHFGTAVKLCAKGGTVVIGSPSHNEGRGGVYAYRFDGSNWKQLGITLTGDHPDAYMGNSVDLSEDGNTLIAGSDGRNNAFGAVLVYLFDGSNWIRTEDLLVGEVGDSYFGLSVSLSFAGRRIASANLKVLNDSVVHRFTLEASPSNCAPTELDIQLSTALSY